MKWTEPRVVLRWIVPFCITTSLLGFVMQAYSACTRPTCKPCPCAEAPTP